MTDLGKMLMVVGAVLIVAGALIMLSGRAHLPIGRLPGDIVYRGKHSTLYFPVVTCIVLSIVLSLIFWVLGRISR